MRAVNTTAARFAATALVILLLFACGQGQRAVFAPHLSDNAELAAPITAAEAAWPSSLPVDALQPWEQVDGAGRVAASINLQSEFVPGVEWFTAAGGVTELGEAAGFASGAPGAEAVSYAIYRIPLGTEQPGTIAADVNLRNGGSYWLGVADYSADTWRWHGPFAAPHVRVGLPHYEYTSELGNLFIAVVAYDGAAFDLVGLGVNARDDGDSSAPDAPAAPTLTPVAGGLHVEWLPVVADDLAGYRVYTNGREALNYVEGGTSVVIPASAETEITLAAVDLSGNESGFSEAATETPLEGAIPAIGLAASAASGGRNAAIELTASGAETYDWDLDGDGTYDVTGDVTGTALASTANLGIIRPALRGHTGGGGFALSAVSLIIAGNSRPVVSARVDVASGQAPLEVEFTLTAEDDDGTIVQYAWDFDGDGTYDGISAANPSPLSHTYSAPGLFNANFRVTDNEGAWAVDTVSVQVLPDPANQMPVITGISASPTLASPGLEVTFTATGYDPDGTIVNWEWDFENDGVYDTSNGAGAQHAYPVVGVYNAKIRATDNGGGYAVGYITVSVEDDPTNIPPVITGVWASPNAGAPPLTVDFAAAATDPDGSIVQWRWDFENDGSWDFTSGSGGNTSHEYTTSGFYTARLRVTDNLGAVSNAYLGISVYYNLPPVALLEADETVFHLGETGSATVNFDASGSYDPEGGSLQYAFDPLGTGGYTSFGASAAYQHIYANTGLYQAGLRVRDNHGAIAQVSQQVQVYRFGSQTVQSEGIVGGHTSLRVVNGNPAISYQDGTSNDIMYVRAMDAAGTAWATPVTVDSAGNVGRYISMAIVGGNPAVSYYDVTEGDLKYARASNVNGTAWGTPIVVDSGGNVGWHTSLAVVNGNPAISYYDYTEGDLKYVRATNASGSSWGTPIVVDGTGIVGEYTSLAVVNGNPAISYRDASNLCLKYIRATNVNGSAWGTPFAVDSEGNVGIYTSLAIADGNPAICYRDNTNLALRYVRAENASGASWGIPVVVDSPGNVGTDCSLAVINGRPAICYREGNLNNLKYVRATDAKGDSWATPLTLDSPGVVGMYTSMTIVNGRPGISYYDLTNEDLKFAYPRLD